MKELQIGDGIIHPPKKPMRLSDISALGTNTAVVVSGRSLFHKNEKEPYGYMVEIATKPIPEKFIGISMPVFLPFDRAKIRELRDCMMESPVFMAEVSFTGLQFRKKRDGGYYATADSFTIVRKEN